MTAPSRVVVFLDYQNVYMGARECFHSRWSPHFEGQIDPLKLAEHIAADSPFDRELAQVRVYRGLPDGTKDPKGYSAARRQIAAWRALDPRVLVFPRPLSYPHGWPDSHKPGEKPREKGIDVSLAIDFAVLAVTRQYDVGVLMSTDTDLKPALEAIPVLAAGRAFPRAEVAAWSGEGQRRRISLGGNKPYCHWLDKTTYSVVCDHTDYSDSALS